MYYHYQKGEETKSQASIAKQDKDMRISLARQQQKSSRQALINKKRGVDTVNLLESKIGSKELSSMIKDKVDLAPPKIVGIMALNQCADINTVYSGICAACMDETKHFTPMAFPTYVLPFSKEAKAKQKIKLIQMPENCREFLDVCLVVDCLICVTSCKEVDVTKINVDPFTSMHTINNSAYEKISMLKMQGWPNIYGVVQHLETIPEKSKKDVKFYCNKFFNDEFGADTGVVYGDMYLPLLRMIALSSTPNIELRKTKSYIIADSVTPKGICGYIYGNYLSANLPLHITNCGNYQISNVYIANDPCSFKAPHGLGGMLLQAANADKRESVDPLTVKENTIQEKEMDADTKMEEISKEESKEDSKMKDDDADISSGEDEMDTKAMEQEENNPSRKHLMATSLRERTKEDMQFPDEVDTPSEGSAVLRFKKYHPFTHYKSLDPKSELPKEFEHIYLFGNPFNSKKVAQKDAEEQGLPIAGMYIFIELEQNQNISQLSLQKYVIASTLSKYESKCTLQTFKLNRTYESTGVLKSKGEYEMLLGFSRFKCNPIFSIIDPSLSHKNRYLREVKDVNAFYATMYALTSFSHSHAILLKEGKPVAEGAIVSQDWKQVILKRIMLTGYPLKIEKRRSVVRYIFFNPDDVNYYKGVEMVTKNGLKGKVKQSIGTHGLMKCFFNGYIQHNDTVILALYKRVFPKLK